MKKSFYLLIFLLTCLMGISIGINSYGLFETEGVAVVEESLGKWIIKINQVDITGVNQEFKVDQFYYTDSELVEGDNLAPGRSGYFELVLDPTGTDVSVLYEIDFDFSKIGNPAIKASVEDLTGGNIVQTGENQYTGVLKLADIKKGTTNTVRVNITWEDLEDNNVIDSNLGTTPNAKVSIPVSVRVLQYTNDPIIPYVPS